MEKDLALKLTSSVNVVSNANKDRETLRTCAYSVHTQIMSNMYKCKIIGKRERANLVVQPVQFFHM